MRQEVRPFRDGMTSRPEKIPAGTVLWRIHRTKRLATEFKPFAPHALGGRFDATADDPYACLYAAWDPTTALAETLVRSRDFDSDTRYRLVPRALVVGKSLSAVRTRCDLFAVPLESSEQLADVHQDARLLEGEGEEHYERARRCAGQIRAEIPDGMGLLWQSRHRRPRRALVLFEDRCRARDRRPLELLDHSDNIPDLGSPAGIAKVNLLLEPLWAAIHVPKNSSSGQAEHRPA
ncbi:RES family NAD+ phosphorylase [Streptomyces sp. CBMA29]|uniref:RES family NAD+ phosphorylase n=1 Tax=Streptomyces sp. CBMA29 TaxID=1896314 RepID=UPI001661A6CC|nr:RES family NAD+ phosphorylase [Streptomyces sp. CBMA29]MBD0737660.1 hypothetical protein [Streptomyces sp. CBMA29]